MAALSDIRAGIAANLGTLPGLQVSAYRIGNPTPPTAWVTPKEPLVEFNQTMQSGTAKWSLLVELFVGLPTDIGAQKKLDSFIAGSGALSIKAALEARDGPQGQVSLGGVAEDVIVTHIDGYADYQLGERGAVLGCRIHVEVYTT